MRNIGRKAVSSSPRRGRTTLVPVRASAKKTVTIVIAAFALAASFVLASVSPAAAAPRAEVSPVLFVGNNWDGTADVISRRDAEPADVHAHHAAQHHSRHRRADGRDPHGPRAARLLPRHPRADRRGPRPVRRRHVHARTTAGCWSSRGRASPTSIAHRPQHRRRSSGASASTASAPTTWRSRPTARTSPSRPRPGTSSTSSTRSRARRSAGSPRATRRTRTTTPPTADRIYHASIGLVYTPADQPQLDTTQGRPPLPDRRREHQPDPEADRHGPEARGGRLPEHELRGAADGALAGRAVRLLPGLVLPRLRRVRLRPGPGHPGREPARTRSRRCRASSTCSTPPTMASR